jgi:probable DNA repair protein
VTWSGLIERMFTLDRQSGRLAGRWLPDSAARLMWERLAQRDPAMQGLVSPGLMGRSAYESWRRMHAFLIPLQALEEEENPESHAFARWGREYAASLDRHGWVDGSLALERLDPASAGAALELVGFDALTPSQQSFLERLAADGITVTHRPPASRQGNTVQVECLDRTAELDAAARWAAQRLDRKPDARLAIVVPGLASKRDAVRRTIERVLVPAATLAGGPAPESHGFELASARALSDRPVVAAALDLVDAFARTSDLAITSRLLRNPFLAASPVETDARARLDARVRRDEGPDLGLTRLARLADGHHCAQFGQALRSGLELAQGWPRRALPSRWSRLWFELLAAMGWPGEDLDSSEHQARHRWQALVAEFGACDDYVGPLPRGEAAGLLRDMAQGVLFEPQELRASLLVIDPETCAGMDFDGLWVCGLDVAQWPAHVSPDPFLPRTWQARQRVPRATADIALEEARRLLDRLRHGADEVILSAPQFEDDAPLLPSALLAGIPRGSLEDLWRAPAVAAAQFAARPRLESLVDGTMPPVAPEESSRGGARLLELQAACPFRAQAEFRLGARALEDPELGVAASERGELVHGVLARIWDGLRTQRALRRLSEEDLRTAVRTAIAEETAAARPATQGVMGKLLEIEAAWLEGRVGDLLAADLERPEFTVDAVEKDVSIGIGGLTLGLRIDRVDRLEDGSIAVIDYKTGADADTKAWLEERPKLPQLPLYAEAIGPTQVAAVAFGRVRTGDTGYRGLTRDAASFPGLKSPGARGWPKEFASWDELLLAWRRRLTALATEHVQGDARLAPNPPQACAYCPLAALCRIGETRLATEAEGTDDE